MPAMPLPRAAFASTALASALILAGCAAPRTPIANYVPPASGPSAKLVMRGYGADVYGVFLFTDSTTCTQQQFVGRGRRDGEPPKSVQIAADQWVTLDFMSFDNVRRTSCRIRWSFQPTADRTYLLSGTANTTHCAARLYDATNPDDMKLESTAIQRNVGGNLCMSIADAQDRKKRLTDANPVATSKDEPMLTPAATADDLKGLIKP
jgi:hypothetical protein